MAKTIEAIFENGVFKPKEYPNIPEHKMVSLIIEDLHEEPCDILSLASKIYRDFSPEEIEDIERIATDRQSFSRSNN